MSKPETIPQLLAERIQKSGPRAAQRRKVDGAWQDVTWADYGRAVREINQGFRSLGLGKGDKVAILSQTRVEWTWTDQAVLALGGISVPIYPSNTADQCEYILENSGASVLVVEDAAQLAKFDQVASKCPGVKLVVSFDEKALARGEKLLTLSALRAKGAAFDKQNAGKFEAGISEVRPEDTATFVYTSGTTGNPKGVVLTHRNFISELDGVTSVLSAGENDTVLSFLPLAHIFARVESFAGIHLGWTAAFAESIEKIVENLGEVRPNLMFSVPRIYERAYSKILAGVESGSGLKRALFRWSFGVGERVSRIRQEGGKPGGLLALEFAVADKLVFSKVREKLGMTKLRFAISGGAPLSRKIAEFFHVLGITILEGYGLTETSAAATVNRLEKFKFGTVGQAVPGVEIKIAGDGEILIRGEIVFKGYYQNEQATKEVLSGDGWFHTGDIGVLDAEGFLAITDRKKDLIITSAGKNISPQNIENLLKTDRHISQVMVYGDKRKYLTALFTLNMEEMEKWAAAQGIQDRSAPALAGNARVYEFVSAILAEKNAQLASYETVKKFQILTSDFTVETGELTPTLKVKRKVVTEKYKPLLDSMYDAKEIVD